MESGEFKAFSNLIKVNKDLKWKTLITIKNNVKIIISISGALNSSSWLEDTIS